MKIVHLTSVHPIFDTRVFFKECVSITENGHETILIATDRKDITEYDTKENNFNLYQELNLIEDGDYIQVKGVKILILKRPKSRIQRILKTTKDIYTHAKKENADIYHFHDPELMVVGLLLRLSGKKVVYDIHDYLPSTINYKHWIPDIFKKTLSFTIKHTEYFMIKYVISGIVVATPGFWKKYDVEEKCLVQNFPIIDEFQDPDAQPYSERPNNICYIGNIAKVKGMVELVKALEIVNQEIECTLQLGGNFAPSDFQQELMSFPGAKYINYHGYCDRKKMAAILNSSKIGVITAHPQENYLLAQPVKLFEYMNAGLPVVASNFEVHKKFVEKTDTGILANPKDPSEIADAILELLNNTDKAEKMGANGYGQLKENYNWEIEANSLLNFYTKLMS